MFSTNIISTAYLATIALAPLAAIAYPGLEPSQASAETTPTSFTLKNNLLKASWRIERQRLLAPEFTNLQSSEVFHSANELFGIATRAQAQDPERIFLGMRKTGTELQALISNDELLHDHAFISQLGGGVKGTGRAGMRFGCRFTVVRHGPPGSLRVTPSILLLSGD